MKLNKRIIAVFAAALLAFVCAAPVFAEGADTGSSELSTMLGQSFELMGKGMLGIFVVMIVIFIVIVVLNLLTRPRKKK